MNTDSISALFDSATLTSLFPAERANEFFDALFGDADEGAYDIELSFQDVSADKLNLELLLHERPGHCLACNLTQGLPQVFSRHPIINIDGLVGDINSLLGDLATCKEWSLGYTKQHSNAVHAIPLSITLSE